MEQSRFEEIVRFIREEFKSENEFVSLQEPVFFGNEKKYLLDCIESTYVSSVGQYVERFEREVCKYTGAKYAVSSVNGTSALHMGLLLCGVKPADLVITQPLTFVATCNAITYLGAEPFFVDVDRDTLGLSGEKLQNFLHNETELNKQGECIHLSSGKRVKACVPMHTYGHPVSMNSIKSACDEYNIKIVEDAAEAIGSTYKGKKAGALADIGVLSFNGNKTITCGGGGVILMGNNDQCELAKHLTTQAKVQHPWEYVHDQVGFNHRLSNLHAAVGCAQLENIELILQAKRKLAASYGAFFKELSIEFVSEPKDSRSNYWLNTILMSDVEERNAFLEYSNANNVMTRPAWKLMHKLPMFEQCGAANLEQAEWIEDRLVCLPSGVLKSKIDKELN